MQNYQLGMILEIFHVYVSGDPLFLNKRKCEVISVLQEP